MKRIIQITPYYPPHLGGMEQRVRDLSEHLAKKGHQVEVFTSDIKCPKNKQLKSTKKLKINYLKTWLISKSPLIPSLLFKLMKIPKDSVMHVHVSQAYFPEIVYLVSKLKNIPYIAHVRGDPEPTTLLGRLFLNSYKKIFLKKVLKNADKIIELNEDYKDIFIEKYDLDRKKIIVIPNATDFKIIPEKNLDIKDEIKEILFVGRLTVEKNVESIIRALSILKNKNLKFKIAGGGEDELKLMGLVKELKLEKQVVFLGELDKDRLYTEYTNADLFILPSLYESFGTVLLEAMATGVPIITSDIPGIRSVIKNDYTGLLVKPTPEAVAQAIEKLIHNPKLREKLAKNGLKEVKKYSWDKVVEQTEKVYKQVLKEHNHEIPNKTKK